MVATWIVGTYGSSLAIIYAYNASNTSGHTKKVTVNAMTLAAFCVANIVGTETFLPKDAPRYLPGKISILVLLTGQLGLCFIIRWVNLWINKKKKRELEELKQRNGWSDEDVKRERERATSQSSPSDRCWVSGGREGVNEGCGANERGSTGPEAEGSVWRANERDVSKQVYDIRPTEEDG